MKIVSRAFVLILALTAMTVSAADSIWTTDFEAAKKQAAKEGKDLLLNFTGSDWCGWCIKLDEEVFSKDSFKTEVVKDFVLVTLDYPKDQSKMSKATIDQNAALSEKYQIEGYPTIILTTETGETYTKTGYRENGPEEYMTHLLDAKKTAGAAKKAVTKANLETDPAKRAKMLDEAIGTLAPEVQAEYFQSSVDDIISLDKDNAQKLRNKYLLPREIDTIVGMIDDPNALFAKIDSVIAELKLEGDDLKMFNDLRTEAKIEIELQKLADSVEDPEELLKGIDDIIAKLELDNNYKQQVLSQKIMIHLQINNDVDAALKAIDEAIAVDPASELSENLKKFKESLIEMQKEEQENIEKALQAEEDNDESAAGADDDADTDSDKANDADEDDSDEASETDSE